MTVEEAYRMCIRSDKATELDNVAFDEYIKYNVKRHPHILPPEHQEIMMYHYYDTGTAFSHFYKKAKLIMRNNKLKNILKKYENTL